MTTTIPASQQLLYTQSVVNPINAKPTDAAHIGYLDKDKTMLEVKSVITQQDSVNYYTFRFRTGDTMRMEASANEGVRIQLMDASGTHVIADSSGKDSSLTQMFANLKKQEGVALKNGNYVIKVTYDTGVSKSKNLNYVIDINSGTTFKTKYQTKAYATTILRTLNAGGSLGYSPAASAANLLTSSMDSTTMINIIDYMV